MGIPILIIGKSGNGKSYSMRNFTPDKFGIVTVLGKPLPFKSNIKPFRSTSYATIKDVLLKSKVNTIVIDDAGYLITNQFMAGHSNGKVGSAVFDLYNSIGDNFWDLINYIMNELPENKIVFLTMHEDKSDFGDVKPKTIGKLLDDKVCVEGMFTIVLRSMKKNGKFIFSTESDGFDIAKSPFGMFEEKEIDNDLLFVDKKVREFYNL